MLKGDFVLEKSLPDCDETMHVWCWPCPSKHFCAPCKYTRETISRIPTGSIYIASRKGPLSEINARITNCPYDTIGIIFQSRTRDTYVYTVDSTLIDNKVANKIVVINLLDLITDNSIIHHAVMPLKDFDEENCYTQEDYENLGESSYEEFTCDYEDCCDQKEWKARLREQRNEILKDLFKKYRDFGVEYDSYQALASIIGLPVAEAFRTKDAFTAPELVGLILFQAGLIWDDRFDTGGRNPACCFDREFFASLSQNCSEGCCKNDVIVALTTPEAYSTLRCSHRSKHKKDYPELFLQEEHLCKGDEEEDKTIEERIRENLRKYLNETVGERKKSEADPNNEKGGLVIDEEKDEDETVDIDYYSKRDETGYKRCYQPTERYRPHQNQGRFPKPICKIIHAQTILFGSLRVVDFLIDYYHSPNTIPEKIHKSRSMRRNSAGELIAVMESLARECGDRISCDLNKLNISWYLDRLIPIELCNDQEEECEERIEKECDILRKLARRIDHDLIQKKMLHQEGIYLNGTRLLSICKRLSEVSADLHSLACDCNVQIKCNGEDYYDDESCEENKFRVHLDSRDRNASEYLIVLHKYMWRCDWKYKWPESVRYKPSKYSDYCCRIRRIVSELRELKNQIPSNCILLELVICLLKQAERFCRYLHKCQRYCVKPCCHHKN